MTPFIIKPTYWWSYLNPFWWKRKWILETLLAYQWDSRGVEEQIKTAIKDTIVFGKGKIFINRSYKRGN